ncbi:hypothetical protein ACFLTE_06105 [Bacteroidota bacterium]
MPSLMPGMLGAKEAYGISVIKKDKSITIPPKAFKRYELANQDFVLLTSTHEGEGGLSILNKEKAYKSILKKIIDEIHKLDTVIWVGKRTYALTNIIDNKIILDDSLLHAFNLKIGDKLLVVKSTTIAISCTPIEIWKKKLVERGFLEAVNNMNNLKEY